MFTSTLCPPNECESSYSKSKHSIIRKCKKQYNIETATPLIVKFTGIRMNRDLSFKRAIYVSKTYAPPNLQTSLSITQNFQLSYSQCQLNSDWMGQTNIKNSKAYLKFDRDNRPIHDRILVLIQTPCSQVLNTYRLL